MGVPLTILDNFNHEEYEILGSTCQSTENKKRVVERLGEERLKDLRASGNTGNYTENMYVYCYYKEGKLKKPFGRVLIKRKRGK